MADSPGVKVSISQLMVLSVFMWILPFDWENLSILITESMRKLSITTISVILALPSLLIFSVSSHLDTCSAKITSGPFVIMFSNLR